MLQSILGRLSDSLYSFGRAKEANKTIPSPLNPWEIPKRDKFYITSEELKIVGLALNHYQKYLRRKHATEKLQQVAGLDHRIFRFIHFLEAKDRKVSSVSEMV